MGKTNIIQRYSLLTVEDSSNNSRSFVSSCMNKLISIEHSTSNANIYGTGDFGLKQYKSETSYKLQLKILLNTVWLTTLQKKVVSNF